MSEARSFIPAAGHDWLLPFYDPVQWLLRGAGARSAIVEEAGLEPGQRVLDIGCGTGSLVVALAKEHPEVEVVGLDPDPKALARAEAKLRRAGLRVQLDRGFADQLPYPDDSFDRVFSSFMFHHLDHEVKQGTLREVRRVLRPGGSLHLLDFGGTGDHGFLARLFHAHEDLHDNLGDGIPRLMGEAGLADPTQTGGRKTLFGRIATWRAAAGG